MKSLVKTKSELALITDEQYVREILHRVSFRSQCNSNEVRVYYSFLAKNPAFSFTQELDLVSENPESTWKQLREFIAQYLFTEDVL